MLPASIFLTMKSLKFKFSHPFKGQARVNMHGQPDCSCKPLFPDSKGSDLMEIILTGFQSGKYNSTPDCEAGDKYFMHQQEFKINESNHFIATTT